MMCCLVSAKPLPAPVLDMLCIATLATNTSEIWFKMRPRQNGPHLADDIFKCIFLNENGWISIEISLKFVPKGPINNIPALDQIMAWHWPADKPLSEPMKVSFLMHICVTRSQWVNSSPPGQNGHHFADNIFSIGSGKGLAPNLVFRRIYAALGGDELNKVWLEVYN